MPLEKEEQRLRRKRRIRKHVFGNTERPRLVVFRSNKHIYAQVVDDVSARALAAVSTLSKELNGSLEGQKKAERARLVGEAIAKVCLDRGIKQVVFDRNGYAYHGRISALAAGARSGGLEF